MCGIITIIKKSDDGIPTKTSILGMLTAQQNRGLQGFGYVACDDEVTAWRRSETRYEIEHAIEKVSSRSIMFHHRFPTSTPNLADCTHPIKVSHDELESDYYLVHNGHINNNSILHERHIELGYEYITTVKSIIRTQNHCDERVKFNDSEALAIDIARFLEGKQDKITASGSIAFVCIRVNKDTNKVEKVFFGRNSSPLTMRHTENALVLRSEGESESIMPHYLYTLSLDTFEMSKEHCTIGDIGISRVNTSGYYDMTDNERDEYMGYSQAIAYDPVGDQDYGDENDLIIEEENLKAIEKLDQRIEFLSDQVMDLVEEKKSLEHDNRDGLLDIEIAEITGRISNINEKIAQYQDDMDQIQLGEIDVSNEY